MRAPSSSSTMRRSRGEQLQQPGRRSPLLALLRPRLLPMVGSDPPIAFERRSAARPCRATPPGAGGNDDQEQQQQKQQQQQQQQKRDLDADADGIVARELRTFSGIFAGSNTPTAEKLGGYVFRDVAAAEIYAFDLEAVAGPQLAEATRACAVRAARAVFGPERMPPGDALYRAALDATLPATVLPHEAAILARLLVDEGLVDFFGAEGVGEEEEEEEAGGGALEAAAAAAAAAGGGAGGTTTTTATTTAAAAAAASKRRREPPEQQKQQPPRTVRPLLPAEIVEHWDEVRAACLQRWAAAGDARGMGEEGAATTPADVDELLRAAFLQAQLEFEFAGERVAEEEEDREKARAQERAPAVAAESPSSTSSRIARFGPRRASAAAAAAASAAAASATLARAVAEAPDLVYVLCAGHARCVAAGALRRAGVRSGAGHRRGRPLSAARRCVPVFAPSLEAAAEKALDLQDARDRVRFVFDRPSRAERVRAHLEVLERQAAGRGRGGGGGAAHGADPLPPAPLPPPPRATVHVAEGVCAAASHRAAAAASGALLSEREVLEGLGVADSPAVMDGLDWRRRRN